MADNLKTAKRSTTHPDYETLPDCIKHLFTAKEYAWLGSERERLVERECYPDHEVIE